MHDHILSGRKVIERVQKHKKCGLRESGIVFFVFGPENGEKKETTFARSGIRTHTSNKRPEDPNSSTNGILSLWYWLKSGAFDHSAILAACRPNHHNFPSLQLQITVESYSIEET